MFIANWFVFETRINGFNFLIMGLLRRGFKLLAMMCCTMKSPFWNNDTYRKKYVNQDMPYFTNFCFYWEDHHWMTEKQDHLHPKINSCSMIQQRWPLLEMQSPLSKKKYIQSHFKSSLKQFSSHSVMNNVTNPQSRWWNKSGFSSRLISFLLGKLVYYITISISHISHFTNFKTSVVCHSRFPLELFFSLASSLYLHKVANSTCKQLLKDSWPSIWWRLQASITVIWLESRSSSIFIIWKIASKGNEKSFLFKTQSHLNNSCHYLKIAISLRLSKEIFCIVWKNKEETELYLP